MNKSLSISLVVIGAILVSALVFFAGFSVASNRLAPIGTWMESQFGEGMMGQSGQNYFNGMGSGMMGGSDQGYAYGMGMMNGSMMMSGMMGSSFFGAYTGDPISLEQAENAVSDFLTDNGDEDLILGEIMIFENHAYAQIIEASTGIGAMEVLVDPSTLAVYPEFGPNMMWNTKYGGMGSFGMSGMMGMGNMMGSIGSQDFEADQSIDGARAQEIAQEYLDSNSRGLIADEHADPFYGYFTLHVIDGSDVTGMLSVNAISGQIFPHTWHGELIEMSGE